MLKKPLRQSVYIRLPVLVPTVVNTCSFEAGERSANDSCSLLSGPASKRVAQTASPPPPSTTNVCRNLQLSEAINLEETRDNEHHTLPTATRITHSASTVRESMDAEMFGQRAVRFEQSPSAHSSNSSRDSKAQNAGSIAPTDDEDDDDDIGRSNDHTPVQTNYRLEDVEDDDRLGSNGVGPPRTTSYSWSPATSTNPVTGRPRSGSGSSYPAQGETGPTEIPSRLQRPAPPIRTPSSTYAPVRHPMNILSPQNRHRSSSASRSRRDPISLYRSQEKAYVQRIRQDPISDYFNSTSNLLMYQGEPELEDESPSSELHPDNDMYEADSLLFYGQDEMEPSMEELKIPENRERLEWHSMLASVLMGDVVKQEKKRLIGSTEETEVATMKAEVFIGLRAKVCGRSLAAQRKLIDDGRAKADKLIDEVIHFEIHGKDRDDKTPQEQVSDILLRWERFELLWPTSTAMREAKPLVGSPAFIESWEAIVAWNNITQLINTELKILRNWVGNDELDFSGPQAAAVDTEALGIDRESTFIDRILKEDNLKSLTAESNMLIALGAVIDKAKQTLIHYAVAFELRHLPPYVEELLVLIGFPTRLIEEVIGMRLKYAERMREPVSMMTSQLILQFQSVLQLAVKIKQEYTIISAPEPGWDLPPCMDENFEQVVLHGLRYYFKLIGWRIGSNKNTFKEAEILETEWHFSNDIGRFIEGGDLEVAEQFRFAMPCIFE